MPRYTNTFFVKVVPPLIYKVQEELNADEELKGVKTTFEQKVGPFGVMLVVMFVMEDVTHEKGLECRDRAMSIFAKYGGTPVLAP